MTANKKYALIDDVIIYLKQNFAEGDYTVLEELLQFVPLENLIHSLPEERWKEFGDTEN